MSTYQRNEVSDKLKIIYLELLCKGKPKLVLSELSKHHYPIDDSLQLCR